MRQFLAVNYSESECIACTIGSGEVNLMLVLEVETPASCDRCNEYETGQTIDQYLTQIQQCHWVNDMINITITDRSLVSMHWLSCYISYHIYIQMYHSQCILTSHYYSSSNCEFTRMGSEDSVAVIELWVEGAGVRCRWYVGGIGNDVAVVLVVLDCVYVPWPMDRTAD
jgi:hypothetical protein